MIKKAKWFFDEKVLNYVFNWVKKFQNFAYFDILLTFFDFQNSVTFDRIMLWP